MATDSRAGRLQLAALRLREIQDEANAIYRRFPELDRRPKSSRTRTPRAVGQRSTNVLAWPVKLH
jgi:hypothetical protein